MMLNPYKSSHNERTIDHQKMRQASIDNHLTTSSPPEPGENLSKGNDWCLDRLESIATIAQPLLCCSAKLSYQICRTCCRVLTMLVDRFERSHTRHRLTI